MTVFFFGRPGERKPRVFTCVRTDVSTERVAMVAAHCAMNFTPALREIARFASVNHGDETM